jgi:hypothetical protein
MTTLTVQGTSEESATRLLDFKDHGGVDAAE